MCNLQDYEASLPLAQAISLEDIKTPSIPVGIYSQEAEDLHQWCQKDKEALMGAGVPEDYFDLLNRAAGGLRQAQSIWSEEQKTRQDAEQQWADEAPEAFDLRDRMVHAFRYAYRKDDDLLGRVSAINEGSSNADMIQDLNDLAILGQSNPEPLQAINFDMALLEQCAATSAKLADIRAMANGEKFETNESLLIRNRMYTLLKTYVDAIRDAGKYLFWRDERRLVGYGSRFLRDKNRKAKAE
ncbi:MULTISPECIES: hypothetical protein [unclassified Carboxylicivirga]|uniref:hypothetical protein n=1 Tax=Carboxylicivirga TaxID=1628153 RepID=UPI003D343108